MSVSEPMAIARDSSIASATRELARGASGGVATCVSACAAASSSARARRLVPHSVPGSAHRLDHGGSPGRSSLRRRYPT